MNGFQETASQMKVRTDMTPKVSTTSWSRDQKPQIFIILANLGQIWVNFGQKGLFFEIFTKK